MRTAHLLLVLDIRTAPPTMVSAHAQDAEDVPVYPPGHRPLVIIEAQGYTYADAVARLGVCFRLRRPHDDWAIPLMTADCRRELGV